MLLMTISMLVTQLPLYIVSTIMLVVGILCVLINLVMFMVEEEVHLWYHKECCVCYMYMPDNERMCYYH